MGWKQSLKSAIRALKADEATLKREIVKVQRKIREVEALVKQDSSGNPTSDSRRLSAEGRAAISRAAKKRWAKYRHEQHSD